MCEESGHIIQYQAAEYNLEIVLVAHFDFECKTIERNEVHPMWIHGYIRPLEARKHLDST